MRMHVYISLHVLSENSGGSLRERGRPLGRWCVSVAAIVTAVAPCHRGRSAQPHAVPLRRSPSRHLSGSEPNSAIQCIQVAAISLAVNPVKFVHTLQLGSYPGSCMQLPARQPQAAAMRVTRAYTVGPS